MKARIRRGQYQALRAANAELVRLYWDIGEAIHRNHVPIRQLFEWHLPRRRRDVAFPRILSRPIFEPTEPIPGR